VALAQLIYKCSKSGWGTVRMSSSDWANELGLTRNEFENLNDCINLLELGTAIKCQIGTIKKIAYTLNEEAIKEALKNPHVEYSICRKQRINTLNSTYQHDENNVSTRTEQRINTFETTHIKEIKSNKSNEEIKEPLTETSSVVPDGLFKSDKLKEIAEQAIGKNEQAKPKSKPKKELSELDKEIAQKVKEVGDRFIKWYEAHKKIAYIPKRYEFSNLNDLFKQLCNNKGYTPDMVVKDIEKIVNGYSKLKEFSQNNFSLNLIATKHNVLLSEIDSYKAPVERKNFNEPVPFVPAIKEKIDYYNTMPLPVGLSDEIFRELGEAIYREKIMDEEVDPKEIGISQFTEIIYKQVRTMNQQQIKDLLDTYGIV